eukprot:3573957-Rhodomonas_salina.1
MASLLGHSQAKSVINCETSIPSHGQHPEHSTTATQVQAESEAKEGPLHVEKECPVPSPGPDAQSPPPRFLPDQERDAVGGRGLQRVDRRAHRLVVQQRRARLVGNKGCDHPLL